MSRLIQFGVGIAIASCLPGAADAAKNGHALPFVLAGLCAILPDWIGRMARNRSWRNTTSIAPDPLAHNPQMIADGISGAISKACLTGRSQSLSLNPVRLSEDEWEPYRVVFLQDPPRVEVSFPGQGLDAQARLCVPTQSAGSTTMAIGAGRQVTLHITPDDDQRVLLGRHSPSSDWSHGIATALLLALALTLVFDQLSGKVAFTAYVAHVLIDQIGHDGCAWFAPFRTQRYRGLRWLPRDSVKMNIMIVMLCTAVTLANLK
ncbi:MAG: metal-dependent hydrolase [Verrucomicrobia bacterium]|nr:metal-dependent hydrolase [Verrucomicrobiota bacterium]